MTQSCGKCGPGYNALWEWFGLSYASFLVVPRVLLHEMPDEWQGKMAELLKEYEETYPMDDMEPIIPRVNATVDGKLTKFPEWVLNYRHPNAREINKCRHSPRPEKEKKCC